MSICADSSLLKTRLEAKATAAVQGALQRRIDLVGARIYSVERELLDLPIAELAGQAYRIADCCLRLESLRKELHSILLGDGTAIE